MYSIVAVNFNRKFIDGADCHKVTLVTSQAYPDRLCLIMFTLQNSLRILNSLIQINLGTGMQQVGIISHESNESLMVTLLIFRSLGTFKCVLCLKLV